MILSVAKATMIPITVDNPLKGILSRFPVAKTVVTAAKIIGITLNLVSLKTARWKNKTIKVMTNSHKITVGKLERIMDKVDFSRKKTSAYT